MRVLPKTRPLLVATVAILILVGAAPAVAEPVDAPYEEVRDHRAAGVFGVAIAGQAALLIPTLSGVGLGGDFADMPTNLGFGLMLGISPVVSSAIGYAVAGGSNAYDPSFGSMVVGGYAGSLLAMTGVLLFTELDDPKADGKYDGSYFDGDDGNQWGVLALGLGPILLPALGIAIAYRLGRSRKPSSRPHHRQVAFQIPTPLIIREKTKEKSYAPGIQLVSMTF